MTLQEESIHVEDLKQQLKDDIPLPLNNNIGRFNETVKIINEWEDRIDSLSPFELAKLEMYYNKAAREAWKVAGYYKSQYQFYFGRASTERGKSYIYERETNKRAVNDSNYSSRIKEGESLEVSGVYEGYFVTWRGIAQTYEGMTNVLKDMIKAIDKEGGS